MLRGLFISALILATPSCFDPGNRILAARPALLTKDDVLLVDGARLTLTDFFNLKERFPGLATDQLLWAMTACLALQNDARRQGREPASEALIQTVRYTMGNMPISEAEPGLRAYLGNSSASLPSPEALRKETNKILARSVVQKNIQVLAEIH